MSDIVNPLANPKGVKKLCELCQKPAKRQCTKCLVTFYCNSEHQQNDWTSIHEKVCPLLVSIHAPAPFGTLQSDREHHLKETLKKQKNLVEIAHLEAQRWVSMKRFRDALPAALLFLRWAMQVYGPCAVELVPAYLLLAQANIGLGSLSLANEYLSKAEWTLMKTPGCSHTVLHQLHRTLGRLHAAMGKYTSALTHFANDVYYASEVFGLESTVTSGGYFLLADVFLKQNKPDVAHSLYTEVANSWHAHLCKLMDGISQSSTQPEECFDEAQCVETDQMLRCILEFEEQRVKPHPDQSAMLAHSLAMLWLLCNNHTKALEYGKKAEALIQGLSEQNALRESIHNLLQHAEKHLE
ncbi:zinc finger MYND domain-containing protein 12 isoform X2 [Puntigrus tetrazona]|uniref:zinc finger MYND domain-containing protein 12 isoform X2 n=1 Tax=Puntigrus tetrazona TaxID=1606681 RepID=UPI001C8A2274|nr:zinc finger MYND domain-containing protein 12 isoform X2 [Puntigrus tetrazona]